MLCYILLLLFSGVLVASNGAISNRDGQTRLVYQFPNLTRLENVAVRSNGNLLLSTLSHPELVSINPLASNPKPSVVYRFPNATSIFGIAEMSPEIFAVATANLSLTGAYAPNSYAVWVVDLRNHIPEVRKVADMRAGTTLNGLARLSHDTLLGSDIVAGVVHHISLKIGKSHIALQDETMQAPENLPGFGINGIRIHGRYLYYVNTGKGYFCRIPLDLRTGNAAGLVEIISNGVKGADDFALSNTAQVAYVANVMQNLLQKVTSNGKVGVIAGGPEGTLFFGPTSAQLGRTLRDRRVVYVVSSGAVFNPSTGGFDSVEGGKIVAVKDYT